MSKYRFKTEEEFKADGQWDHKHNKPDYSWVYDMIKQVGQPIDDENNERLERSMSFVLKSDGYIYASNTTKLMEEQLLPIGTKVYITDNSEHYSQGINTDGTKKIGIIKEHLSSSYMHNQYIYEISWNNKFYDINTYQGCDVEPVEPIKEQEINEEQINNELKDLFKQILNN